MRDQSASSEEAVKQAVAARLIELIEAKVAKLPSDDRGYAILKEEIAKRRPLTKRSAV